jgi:hypothetical protein
MATDAQRQQAFDAAYDALTPFTGHAQIRAQAAETIVTELANLGASDLQWLLTAGIAARSEYLEAYLTLAAAFRLPRDETDPAVVAAANLLAQHH